MQSFAQLTIITAILSIGFNVSAEPSLHLSTQMGYVCHKSSKRYHGAGFGTAAALFFNDAWGIRGGYAFNDFRSKGSAFRIQQGELDAIYQLDVFAFVPWVSIGAVANVHGGEPLGDGIQSGFSFKFGLDRLLDAKWLIGAMVEVESMADADESPALLSLMVRLGYRWTFGDPYAP